MTQSFRSLPLIISTVLCGAVGINVVLYAMIESSEPGAGGLVVFLAPFAIPVGAIAGWIFGLILDKARRMMTAV